MKWELTAVFRPVDGGSTASTKEFPGVVAHGSTLDEARESLRGAVRRTVESRRALAAQQLAGAPCIEEEMVVTSSTDGGYQFSVPGT